MKLFRILKEVNNYYFIKKTIKKNKDTDLWNKHNLRIGYFGIIYTVVNLPPEVFESEEQYYQMYVIEQLKPINEYLATLNLQEVITPIMENQVNKEAGIYAFGIKYIPFFRDLSIGWILKWLTIIGLSSWAILKFSLADKVVSSVTWIQSLI